MDLQWIQIIMVCASIWPAYNPWSVGAQERGSVTELGLRQKGHRGF